MSKSVVVAGATGFLGARLCSDLASLGWRVSALARSEKAGSALAGVRILPWNGRDLDAGWADDTAQADAVINLAGAPIAGRRWTPEVKRELVESRLSTTKAIVRALGKGGGRPRVLVNASAVGIYGDRGDEELCETSPPGKGFLADLCVEWEAAAMEAVQFGVRVVPARIGIVLGRGGGALPEMAKPFRYFAGGPIGNGRQWVPWVHQSDTLGLLIWALETDAVSGPVNVVSPNPVRQMELARAIGRALHRPALAPAPGFALKLLVGEFAESLLAGQRVKPAVAQQLGYTWRFSEVQEAVAAELT